MTKLLIILYCSIIFGCHHKNDHEQNNENSLNKLSLPNTTGKYHIGSALFELTDSTRQDIIKRSIKRTLTGQIWYPTELSEGHTIPYLNKSLVEHLKNIKFYEIDNKVLAGLPIIKTHSIANAPIIRTKIPVVFFSMDWVHRKGCILFYMKI